MILFDLCARGLGDVGGF